MKVQEKQESHVNNLLWSMRVFVYMGDKKAFVGMKESILQPMSTYQVGEPGSQEKVCEIVHIWPI